MPSGWKPETPRPPRRPTPAAPGALESLSHAGLQDLLVQRELRDQLLELPVLVAQQRELAQLERADAVVLLPPAIERRLRDPELPADLEDGDAALGLPQGGDDLLLRVRCNTGRVDFGAVAAGGCDADGTRRVVDDRRAAAAAGAVARTWRTTTGAGSGCTGGDPLRAPERLSVVPPAPGDGLRLREHVLAPAPRLASGRRVDAPRARVAEPPRRRGPDRLEPGVGRLDQRPGKKGFIRDFRGRPRGS